jgi:alpha-N-arabinofuranosidase
MSPQPATVDISVAQPSLGYSRNIFGHFIEHFHSQVYGGIFDPASPLSNQMGFREDVIEAIRELAPSVVRWPGGCFVSGYHWVDGVGPQRRPHYDKAWRVTDPNTFGTHEFVDWCAAIGAEAYICTNAGTGGSWRSGRTRVR